MVEAKGLLILSTSEEVGFPVSDMILSSWFMVEEPGKIGRSEIISPIIHPTDQISTPLVYLVLPRRISGARYHLVAT